MKSTPVAYTIEPRRYAERGHTPRVKPAKACASCSLRDLCLPQLQRSGSVSDYVTRHITEDTPCESC